MAAPADGGRGDGMDPRFTQGVVPEPPRLELRLHRGGKTRVAGFARPDRPRHREHVFRRNDPAMVPSCNSA